MEERVETEVEILDDRFRDDMVTIEKYHSVFRFFPHASETPSGHDCAKSNRAGETSIEVGDMQTSLPCHWTKASQHPRLLPRLTFCELPRSKLADERRIEETCQR